VGLLSTGDLNPAHPSKGRKKVLTEAGPGLTSTLGFFLGGKVRPGQEVRTVQGQASC
jgi:hypothetical protein